MKNLLPSLAIISVSSCNSGDNHDIAIPKTDTEVKPITVTDLRNARPKFPGNFEQRLNLRDTRRYLRIVLNNDRLMKTWMVYFDQPQHKWITLTWIGKGTNNKILVDSIFKDFIDISNIYEDPPSFYVSYSDNEGKKWEPLDLSLATLTDCIHPDLRKIKKAQLIVCNDFTRDNHTPSLSYV